MRVKVGGCPCGQLHYVGRVGAIAVVKRQIEEPGETIAVTCGPATYAIPRLFIALHGLKASELPQLATKYGWEQTPTELGDPQ